MKLLDVCQPIKLVGINQLISCCDDVHGATNNCNYFSNSHTSYFMYPTFPPPGSPFQFTVGPIVGGGAHKVKAVGPGLERAVVHEPGVCLCVPTTPLYHNFHLFHPHHHNSSLHTPTHHSAVQRAHEGGRSRLFVHRNGGPLQGRHPVYRRQGRVVSRHVHV